MMKIQGKTGAPGYASGIALKIRNRTISIARNTVEDPAAEVHTLDDARARYQNSLFNLSARAKEDGRKTEAEIFDAYQVILQDDIFFDAVKELVLQEKVCASWAIDQKRAETEKMFSSIEDEYLKARVDDINNVCHELMAELQGVAAADPFASAPGDNIIVFAEDLTPTDTVRLDRTRLKGLVTEKGGATSHTVILAKALGIPAIVGTGPLLEKFDDGAAVLVDGAAGTVVINPDEAAEKAFREVCTVAAKLQRRFDLCKSKPAVTQDGYSIRVDINSGDKESINNFDPDICDGVGLFRTEFLYMGQSDYPSEEFQFQTYKNMAIRTKEKELIIRTLDIGGDKQLDYMNLPKETNPFLGYRAIRFCLDRTDVFKTQLRAILRASAYGNVKVMFPMIVNMEEVSAAKRLLNEAMAELDARGEKYRKDIPIGIMVETPAAALLSDRLAEQVSFFSIGSNDLIQYITAADRMNDKVQSVYDSCNISFLRAVHMVAQNAHRVGIPVAICGETASEPRLIPLWCAMGIDELSVAPALIGRTKYLVSCFSREKMKSLMEEMLSTGDIQHCKEQLDGMVNKFI